MSKVTITLGRSGQVVKRRGVETDFAQSSVDSGSELRRKLNVKRSYDNAEEFYSSTNKRQRGDGIYFSSSNNRNEAFQVNRNDLRWKLMRKNQSKKVGVAEEHSRMHLHKKNSKDTLPSGSRDILHRRHQMKGNNLVRKTRSRESADDLYLLQSQRKNTVSYIDRFRDRSPDGIVKSSMGLSPPRFYDEISRTTSMREVDRSRDEWFLRNSVAESYRPGDSAPGKMKALPVSSKPPQELTPISGSLHRSSLLGEGSLSVGGMLNSLGLGKYAIHFQAEEIDMAALRQMGDKDLKELGIPMGPRKKILLALVPWFKQLPRPPLSIARA